MFSNESPSVSNKSSNICLATSSASGLGEGDNGLVHHQPRGITPSCSSSSGGIFDASIIATSVSKSSFVLYVFVCLFSSSASARISSCCCSSSSIGSSQELFAIVAHACSPGACAAGQELTGFIGVHDQGVVGQGIVHGCLDGFFDCSIGFCLGGNVS